MSRAIRELGASPFANATERQATAPTASEPSSKDTAECCQVTVLFSDLVGLTVLSAAWSKPLRLRLVHQGFDTRDLNETKALFKALAEWVSADRNQEDLKWSVR